MDLFPPRSTKLTTGHPGPRYREAINYASPQADTSAGVNRTLLYSYQATSRSQPFFPRHPPSSSDELGQRRNNICILLRYRRRPTSQCHLPASNSPPLRCEQLQSFNTLILFFVSRVAAIALRETSAFCSLFVVELLRELQRRQHQASNVVSTFILNPYNGSYTSTFRSGNIRSLVSRYPTFNTSIGA